jgi:hypothetical protein
MKWGEGLERRRELPLAAAAADHRVAKSDPYWWPNLSKKRALAAAPVAPSLLPKWNLSEC